MKYMLIAIVFPVLLVRQCSETKNKTLPEAEQPGPVQTKDSIPECVREKINAIKKEPKWNPPAQVNEYLYSGKTVFLFSSNCCDQFDMLYNDSCGAVCAPYGGIVGQGDGKCKDFTDSAKLVKLVWKDPR
jgi:hypothetical protein